MRKCSIEGLENIGDYFLDDSENMIVKCDKALYLHICEMIGGNAENVTHLVGCKPFLGTYSLKKYKLGHLLAIVNNWHRFESSKKNINTNEVVENAYLKVDIETTFGGEITIDDKTMKELISSANKEAIRKAYLKGVCEGLELIELHPIDLDLANKDFEVYWESVRGDYE